jgi:DNA-binding LacI/PurR family transcriptional regulator
VLNGGRNAVPIREQTRQRILQAAADLAYTPNAAARALSHGRTHALGVVCYDITDPVVGRFLDAVEAQADGAGYRVVICTTHRDASREAADGDAYISLLHEHSVDGILIFSEQFIAAGDYGQALSELPLTMSVVGLCHSGAVVLGGFDYYAAGVKVGEHLAALGHRQCAFLTSPLDTATARLREAGVRDGLAVRGAQLITVGDQIELPAAEAGYAAVHQLRATHPAVTAAVARNDLIALGGLRALTNSGVCVPDEFSLVTWGDTFFASHLCPSLTAVRLPVEEMGRRMATTLLEALSGEPLAPYYVTLEPELILRESTGPVAHSSLAAEPSILVRSASHETPRT